MILPSPRLALPLLALLLALAAALPASADQDGDGIADADDNCLILANADQRDTNLDGYGNACDPDYSNNGLVNALDFTHYLSPAFGSTSNDPHYNPDTDHDGDGDVDEDDVAVFQDAAGGPPGPSGLACAGTTPCFAPDLDYDADGIANADDNCLRRMNPPQVDSDGDGFGNRCDGDFDDTGVVDVADTAILDCARFGQPPLNYYTPDEPNLNNDALVNANDWTFFTNNLLGAPPGPSGLASTGPFDGPDPFGDADGDGVPLYQDNCSGLPNPDQRDTNFEGYGNTCDADYNNNNLVNAVDFNILGAAMGSTLGDPNYNPHTDHDGDGDVDSADAAVFQAAIGAAPGPTGRACAPTNFPPVCPPSAFEIDNNAPTYSDVLQASDPDADPLAFAVEVAPSRGTLDVDPETGAFDYTPLPETSGGRDRFEVSVSDGQAAPVSCDVEVYLNPVTCPGCCPDTNGPHNCFAVFVMPDTQEHVVYYNNDGPAEPNVHPFPERSARLLERINEWVCAHRNGWLDPFSGRTMEVKLLVHLGDIVNGNHLEPDEWERADRAFDVLDACQMPYLAVAGNHDWDASPSSTAADVDTLFYDEYFGETDGAGGANLHGRHFADARCGDGAPAPIPAACDGESAWYLGGGGRQTSESADPPGNLIEAFSRPPSGPSVDHPGRHRAGFVRAPDGRPFLFVGTEFDPGLPFSSDWPAALISSNPDVPTLVFNHQGVPPGQAPWDALVVSQPNVYLALNGHVENKDGSRVLVTRGDGTVHVVPKVTRNFQWLGATGWNAILVVDPDKGEIRLRSYELVGDESSGDVGPVEIEEGHWDLGDEPYGSAHRAHHEVYPLLPAEAP